MENGFLSEISKKFSGKLTKALQGFQTLEGL